MERVKAIMKEYDIAGTVILHTPGFSEFLIKIDPSYSCARLNGDELRIRAKLQEDFGGDKEAWNKKIEDTVNMIDHLGDVGGNISLNMFKTMDLLKQNLDIESTKGNYSSHTTQNN